MVARKARHMGDPFECAVGAKSCACLGRGHARRAASLFFFLFSPGARESLAAKFGGVILPKKTEFGGKAEPRGRQLLIGP